MRKLLNAAMYTNIKSLWERYRNKTKIALETGHDWKTVSKVIKQVEEGREYPVRKSQSKILDSYKDKILEWLEDGLTRVRIHEELRGQGVKVAYPTVKRFLSGIKKRKNIFVRIHTLPGEEAQADFGYVGLTPDNNGKRRKTWVFNMRLSYSRLDYYEKVYNQRVETFIQCHINAFKYFGGIPKYVKIDNLKAAILEANFYEPVYQQMYKSFAEHYGFSPIPCRVYTPNDKGKVESGIKYVKQNFFLGRKFQDGDDLDRQLRNWLDRTCNSRLHGTTKKIPKEVFLADEKDKLKLLPLEEFKITKVGMRKVYHDCHIYVEHNYYSVPFEYVGKEVEIELTDNLLRVSYKHKEVAIHPKLSGIGKWSTVPSHYPKYKLYSETEFQEKYQIKMKAIGDYAEQLFFLILKNRPHDWTRPVQGILSLPKSYSKDIVDLACKRAVAYDIHTYQTVKNICKNRSYLLPVEFDFQGENMPCNF